MNDFTRSPGSGEEHRFAWKSALLTSLVATAIAFFSIRFAQSQTTIAMLWYPTALFASLIVTQRPRHWPMSLTLAYFSILLAHFAVNNFTISWSAFVLPMISAMGAFTFAWTIRQFICKPLQLDPVVDRDWFFRIDLPIFIRFLAFSILPGVLLPALAGSVVLAVAQDLPMLTSFEAWLAGDGLGAIGLLPFVFCVVAMPLGSTLKTLLAPKTVFFLALILMALATNSGSDLVLFYTTAILAAAAAVSGLTSTAALTLVVSVVFGYGIEIGFLTDNPQIETDRLLSTYLPLMLSLLPGLFIAVSRQELDNRLFNARSRLDQSEQIRAVMTSEMPLFCFVRSLGSEDAVYLTPALKQYVYGDPNAPGPYSPLNIFHPDDIAAMRDGNARNEKKPQPYSNELRVRQSDGGYHWHKIVSYPVLSEENQVIQRVGVMQDVDDLRQTQEQLRAQAAELTRSNQSLEMFALAASHDLQEPLRMVTGYTQLLKKRYASELNEDARSMIDLATDASSRMNILIQELLAFSRVAAPDSVDRGEVSVAIENTQRLLARSIQDHQVSFDIAPSIPAVNLTQSALNQLMLNLIGNSIRYRSQKAPKVSVSVLTIDADKLTLSVRDNGIGIEQEHHKSAFEAFRRFNDSRANEKPGNGIGLSLCHRIVESAGGQISIFSDGKVGTEFRITLRVAGSSH